MLQNEFFYPTPNTERPLVGEFTLRVPTDIGEQISGSNDCGVWVAVWMMDCMLDDSYKITVNDASRMRVALDLVLKAYNEKKEDIIELAFQNWKKLEDRKKVLVKY
ncbi:hypothetical protein SESBI_42005 [Sesbania bispinosa]|nr:hypothetical protein SESBI_42005 [Sesbania bispinosa]